jgi:S1-C subfamily serine protease
MNTRSVQSMGIRVFAILVLLSGLQGCLSVPVNYATPEADAEAKHFRCPEGMSRVYVFRDENFGSAYPLTLSVDERPIGDFAAMTYGVFDRQPGEFEFSSATPESASQVLVSAEAGTINYLWLEIKMGWMYPRVLLQKVDEQRGQQGVNRSRMITFARKERPQRGGQGTAWLVSPRHWVTNHHVVGDRTSVKLVTPEGTTVEARVLTSDPANDLAVLVSEVPYRGALPLRLASMPPKVGERVVAIGHPLASIMGSTAKLTTGDISALAGSSDDPRYYQFSAPIQPGNSGGPLLNSSGEVIGVVTSKLNWELTLKASGQIPEGVNYAVKVAYLRPMLEGISLEASIRVAPMSADEIFSSAGSSVFRVEQ